MKNTNKNNGFGQVRFGYLSGQKVAVKANLILNFLPIIGLQKILF